MIILTLSHSTSRGQDTYGYPIVRLDDESTGKRYRCMGGGYDMVGTVFAEWLQDTHQDALQAISDKAYHRYDCGEQVRPEGLYGMATLVHGRVRLDGACGLESMRPIAEAIGLEVKTRVSPRGRIIGFTVEEA